MTPLSGTCQAIMSFPLPQHLRENKMVTMVGNESDFGKLVKDLIYLEHDAIAAYESTIERLDDKTLSAKVAEFHQDHLQHLTALNRIAAEAGLDAPQKGDMKQMLTTGKIALADMFGDKTILKAMKTNEDDTVTAYERASQHADARPDTKAFFMKAHQDEVRHRAWFETTAEQL
jgi:rubrerythrin